MSVHLDYSEPLHSFGLFNHLLPVQGDPSGNYGGWKAACIGSNAQSALSMLEQDYKEEMNTEEALNLAMTILSKTLDTQTLK